MFNTEELNSLDRKYFNVIAVNEYDATVMSRNTGHYWYMHNPEYPEQGTIILFHRHSGNLCPIITRNGRRACGLRCGISGNMTDFR